MKDKFPTLLSMKSAKFYLCGGAVRDMCLGKPNKDYDFVVRTDLPFKELVNELGKIGNVLVTYPEFFTIKAKIDNEVIDIVYPRREGTYSDGRRPDTVDTVETLYEDSERRDFTFNAMYYDPYKDFIIDYHNGQKHIAYRVLKTVGNPLARFKEDYLRIIRAIRFCLSMNLNMSTEVESAIYGVKDYLDEISADRIRDELNKCFKIDSIGTMKWLIHFDLIDVIERAGIRFEATQKQR